MSSSESESTKVIEEETRRLSGIQQFTIQEQESSTTRPQNLHQ